MLFPLTPYINKLVIYQDVKLVFFEVMYQELYYSIIYSFYDGTLEVTHAKVNKKIQQVPAPSCKFPFICLILRVLGYDYVAVKRLTFKL